MVQTLVTGLSLRNPWFDPRFLVDTVAVGQIAFLIPRLPSSLLFLPNSSSYWHCYYQKDKWAKHGNLPAKKCPFGYRWRIGPKLAVTRFVSLQRVKNFCESNLAHSIWRLFSTFVSFHFTATNHLSALRKTLHLI